MIHSEQCPAGKQVLSSVCETEKQDKTWVFAPSIGMSTTGTVWSSRMLHGARRRCEYVCTRIPRAASLPGPLTALAVQYWSTLHCEGPCENTHHASIMRKALRGDLLWTEGGGSHSRLLSSWLLALRALSSPAQGLSPSPLH